ncbi:iron complex outermembrane receptor protein [Epilithonimonas hungarica]|uniref:SusC/RagA family TonB-linked outer membrane protein n=1 Tax=Epilithonimonas hungarica TaxID=454006 RepID=UPI00277DA0AE|nr:SusC/RagA family TonB-linked outer membrane protein [Epilithonimonas hungarica]MDP9954824.1 iron complex outermembrane receptor protein [Epilithonimonas hungarica]
MRNYNVLKIAPAFLLLGSMLHAQQNDSIKENVIEQVVVIGYGKQKKSDLTGSITSITSKDFNGGATSAEQLIQGKTPGVAITGNSGAPGAGSTIRIRGGVSLSGSNDPLIVIDGVPMDFSGVSGASNALALVNPNDIETFDILKDASATAIYGNRASNGVILITTKKGSAGKLKVNFNTTVSVSTPEGYVDVLDGNAYRNFVNYAANQFPGTVTSSYLDRLGTSNTNWQKLIYQKAWGTDNNVAISGGIKNLPYRLSLGYTDQNGILKENTFRRTSADLSINPKFLDNHLSVNFNAKGSFTDNNFSNQGSVGDAIRFDPTQPIYSGNSAYGGYYEWINADGGINTNGTANPLAGIAAAHNISSVWRGITNVQLDYKLHFLPDLHFNVNAGYDYTKSNGLNQTYAQYRNGDAKKGSYNEYSQEKKNKLLETYFNYVKSISAFKMDLTAGYSYQDFYSNTPENYTYYGNGDAPNHSNRYASQTTLLSFYGRAILSYADKYIVTASYRRDGSSRFYDGLGSLKNVWGNFPGVSVAWKVNEENFLKDVSALSTLKIRAGWGKTGQQQLGDYPAYSKYTYSSSGASYQFGDEFINVLRAAISNPNLKWETTTSKNIGLDFGFINNRITGSFDYYQKDTEDLLAYVPIPAGDLNNYNYLNTGSMRNRGLEGAITIVPVKNETTNWEFTFNATHYDPILTSLSSQISDDYFIAQGSISGGVDSKVQAFKVGYNPYVFQLFQQVYDANGKPVSGAYVDRNGDGKITDADKYFTKSTTPDAILGFSTKLNYKNWDLGFSLRAVLGNYVYNNAASNSTMENLATNNFLQNVFSTQVNNQIVKNGNYWSDLYLENASFLRMDNASIGYNFKDVFSNGTNFRVNVMAQNVFTITNYTGVDPEVQGNIDNGFYQRPRIYSIGFNFQF